CRPRKSGERWRGRRQPVHGRIDRPDPHVWPERRGGVQAHAAGNLAGLASPAGAVGVVVAGRGFFFRPARRQDAAERAVTPHLIDVGQPPWLCPALDRDGLPQEAIWRLYSPYWSWATAMSPRVAPSGASIGPHLGTLHHRNGQRSATI